MNVWGVQAFFAALRENTAVHTLSISHVRVAGISAFVQEAQKTWNERPALKKFSVQLYITTSCNEKLAAQFPRTDPSVIQAICTRQEKPYSFSVER
jgi:NADH pyrophosphatase NudC (nudix superfamily)